MKRSTVTAFTGSVTGNRQRILPRKPFCPADGRVGGDVEGQN